MAGPTSSPARSTEGSSRYSTLASFLQHSSAATPQMGKEAHLTLVSSALGSPCKQPGKGMRPPGLRGSWEAEGLARLRTRLLDVLSSSCSATDGQTQVSPLPKTPRIHMPFTPLAFNYTA